jgi:hypothetical protein
LMDISTKFTSGQEAVEAIFRKDMQPQGRQQEDVPEASAQCGTKKKGKKKSQAKRDAADADLVAAAEHRNLRKPPEGANLFDKMLKESCPYHQGPVKHTLDECVMLRCYFHKTRPSAEGGKGQDNDKKEGNKAEEFPEIHGCFMIYSGRVANASARHSKQERREVCLVKMAAPVYLDWSDKPITFDQGDHPDCVRSPGNYLVVVDPVIGDVRLTKVLMDGGSSLNIIYAETLGLLEIDLSTIRAGAAPFHGIIPRKRVVGAKAKMPPFARCFRQPRCTNGGKTTGRFTLRPTRRRTKTCDEVVASYGLVQHGGPRVIRPIVTGPAWPLRITGLICKGLPIITICNPALWEYSGDNLGA